MSKRIYLFLFIVGVSLVFGAVFGFCEGAAQAQTEPMSEGTVKAEPMSNAAVSTEPVPSAAVQTEPAATFNAETPKTTDVKPPEETKWVWAEVASVDVANNQIVVKYLDYDSDEEKELTVVVDASTRFENVEGIKAIAAADNVGVDYILNDKGEALAKSIAVEKAESMPKIQEEMAPASVPEEIAPAPAQQEAQPVSPVNAVETPAAK
jgi:hypothetical protein